MMSVARGLTWYLMSLKEPIWSTVIPQHPTSEREPRYVFIHPQTFFVFRSDLNQLFHHYFL